MEEIAPEPTLLARLLGTPGWGFHAVFGLGALGVVWAASAPAGLDLLGDPFAWLGLACVVAFLARVVTAVSRDTLTSAFLGAPLIAAAVVGVIYEDIPQEVRWFQAEDGFESALRALPTAKAWDQAKADEATPGRIGTFWVDSVTRDASGAVQFHMSGNPLDGNKPAAITYLVDGPTPAVKDANPGASFDHLHGNWYSVH